VTRSWIQDIAQMLMLLSSSESPEYFRCLRRRECRKWQCEGKTVEKGFVLQSRCRCRYTLCISFLGHNQEFFWNSQTKCMRYLIHLAKHMILMENNQKRLLCTLTIEMND